MIYEAIIIRDPFTGKSKTVCRDCWREGFDAWLIEGEYPSPLNEKTVAKCRECSKLLAVFE